MTTILVIEDDDLLREGIVFVLQSAGFEVLDNATGEEGIALAQSKLPDLITCDLNLPMMTGEEIAEILASDASTANIPILFITGREPTALSSTIQCKYTFVQKPFEPDKLVALIREFVG